MSTVTFVEASIVIEVRRGYEGLRDLDLFISKAEIQLVPVDADQAHLARQAFRQYGKGRHVAGLNFGDCFSYALAKGLSEPLLFKGKDFSRTDVDAVL
jgi:ribonuclease VapC